MIRCQATPSLSLGARCGAARSGAIPRHHKSGPVWQARKQARNLEPPIHTDTHRWDSAYRIGTAAQVRL